MKVLVTGATGFVGRRVASRLVKAGLEVRAMVRDPARVEMLPKEHVEVVRGDLNDAESLHSACDGVEAVVHLAAIIRESIAGTKPKRGAVVRKGGPRITFENVNVEGCRKLVQAAKQMKVEKIVYASTIGAANDPNLRYMQSRWLAEKVIVDSRIPYSILRFSVAFGEGDEFVNPLAAMVKIMPIVPVPGDGKALFQPIAVEDVARCLATTVSTNVGLGMTYDLGGPEALTYDEILKLTVEAVGSKTVLLHVPLIFMRPIVGIMERMMSRPPATTEQLKMLDFDNVGDLDAVKSVFGFQPKTLRGNLGYVNKIGLRDGIRIILGEMPAHVRDH